MTGPLATEHDGFDHCAGCQAADQAASDTTTDAWSKRWSEMHDKYTGVRAENTQLRAALDELNSDVEGFLNVAHQAGHESAKSWLIRAQATAIRQLRANATPTDEGETDE